MTSKSYQCVYCPYNLATPYALKRHISSKHPNPGKDKGESSQSKMPYKEETSYKEEPGLWDDYDYDLPETSYKEEPGLWDDYDLPAEEIGLWDMVRL